MDSEVDPLSIDPSELSLLSDATNDIEFVIENSDEEEDPVYSLEFLQNAVNQNEEDDSIIICVEDGYEENDDSQDNSITSPEGNVSNEVKDEIEIVENSLTYVDQDKASTSKVQKTDSTAARKRKAVSHNTRNRGRGTSSYNLRQNFNESFVSFIGNKSKKKKYTTNETDNLKVSNEHKTTSSASKTRSILKSNVQSDNVDLSSASSNTSSAVTHVKPVSNGDTVVNIMGPKIQIRSSNASLSMTVPHDSTSSGILELNSIPIQISPTLLNNPSNLQNQQSKDQKQHLAVSVNDVSVSGKKSDAATEVNIKNVVKQNAGSNKKGKAALKNPCCVPGCKIEKNEKVYLFRVPIDKTLMNLWDVSIGRQDRRLQNDDVVCEKHFLEDDIIFHLQSSTEKNIDIANKPKLKTGAIPCVKYYETCCVPKCGRTTGKMYAFPITNNANFHLWMYMVKNPVLKSISINELLRHRVCERHFETDCFDASGNFNKSAAPTLFLPEVNTVDLSKNKKMSSKEECSRAYYNLNCAYKNCSQTRNVVRRVFAFPSDYKRCVKWLRACSRTDLIRPTLGATIIKLNSVRFGVCENHFRLQDFDSPLMDKLKPEAIPIEFRRSLTPKVEPNSCSNQTATIENKLLSYKGDGITKSRPILPNICLYVGCQNRPTYDNPFFTFPSHPNRYKLWLEACGYRNFGSVMVRYKICGDHFTEDMFESKFKLKDDAVPIPSAKVISAPSLSTNVKLQVSPVELKETDAQSLDTNGEKVLFCAVLSCVRLYGRYSFKGLNHKFPNPENDEERFDIWMKLIGNDVLADVSPDTIRNTYMVCEKHFEDVFYSLRKKSEGALCDIAVPTLALPRDMKWLYETDFYKTKIRKFLNKTTVIVPDIPKDNDTQNQWKQLDSVNAVPDIPKDNDTHIHWKQLDSVNVEDAEDNARCVLEEDRLSFPGIGYCLYMDTKDSTGTKRKRPYEVYKLTGQSYGLMDDIEYGENIKIHAAIMIDDDDACEREVLQQLLDKRTQV